MSISASAQNGVRVPISVQQQITVAGVTNVVGLPAAPVVAFCNAPANASPCTNKATTYTDSTLLTPCATSTQIVLDGTTSCVANLNAQNQGGVWVPQGQYAYTVTFGGANFGPFFVTAASSGGTQFVSSLPATCSPGVTATVELSVAPYFSYYCNATNTWLPVSNSSFGAITSGGTAQAQLVSVNPPLASSGLTPNLQLCWLPVANNTAAAPTLAGFSGSTFSAKNITKGVNGGTALIANDLSTTVVACAIYDGTQFELQNPANTIAPGIVDGQTATIVTTGSSAALGGTFSKTIAFNEEGTAAAAVTYTLPTAVAGKAYCAVNANNGSAADTGVLTLQTSAAGQFIIFTDGTLSASGGFVSSGGAAADYGCVTGVDGTHWLFTVQSGTWTKH